MCVRDEARDDGSEGAMLTILRKGVWSVVHRAASPLLGTSVAAVSRVRLILFPVSGARLLANYLRLFVLQSWWALDWWEDSGTMDWWACTMDWWASTMDWWASTMETGDDPHHDANLAVILVVCRIPRRMRGGIQTKSFVPENAFSCAFASVYLPQGPLLAEKERDFRPILLCTT